MEVPPTQQRGIGRLAADIALDTVTLVRREVDLARAEVAERARELAGGIAVLVFALAAATIAFAVLVAAAVLIVATWLPAWAAALVVAGATLLIAGSAAGLGVRMVAHGSHLAPQDSIEQARQDIQWLRHPPRFAPTSSGSSTGSPETPTSSTSG